MSRHVHVRWSRLVLATVMAAVLASAAGAARRPHSALDEAERGDRPPDVETVVLRFVHIPAESFLDTLEQLGENEEVGRALEQVPRAVNEPANAVVLIAPPEVAAVLARVADELDQPNEFLVNEQEREAEEAALRAEMEERVGRERLMELVCNPPLTGFTAPKILWVRNHEPQNYERCRKILLPKDYVRFRLSGAFATEVSDASGMLLLDIRRRRWCGVSRFPVPCVFPPPLFPRRNDVYEHPARCGGE